LISKCPSSCGSSLDAPPEFREQFVYSILARGDKVIATRRKLEKLKHLEQAGAAILQLDITDNLVHLGLGRVSQQREPQYYHRSSI